MTQQSYELNRNIDIGDIKEHSEIKLEIIATEAECIALAKRFDILAVEKLTAIVKATMKAGDIYRIKGDIQASVVQACGVTLAPCPEIVKETFEETLTTNPNKVAHEDETDADIEKPVDVIEGNLINVGEVVAQWLALSLNPFPRSDAPVFEYVEDSATAEGKQTHNPFQALAALKDK